MSDAEKPKEVEVNNLRGGIILIVIGILIIVGGIVLYYTPYDIGEILRGGQGNLYWGLNTWDLVTITVGIIYPYRKRIKYLWCYFSILVYPIGWLAYLLGSLLVY